MDKYQLFSKYVKVIEIENTSYCNRQCSFCGNFYIDRRSQKYIMPEEQYKKLIDDLASVNYKGVINFNRYNEPFADRIILKRIRMAHDKLKNVTLMCFSNSDFLNASYLDEIRETGLNILNIQLYSEQPLDYATAIEEINKIRIRLGNHSFMDNPTKNKEIIEYKLNYENMNVFIQYRNFSIIGNSRGGIVSQYIKEEVKGPCYHPIIVMAIDYNGNVMPCCHLRSDYKLHKEFVLGNIFDNSIIDIYSSNEAKKFRKMLLISNRPDVCKFCNDNKESIVRGDAIL